MRVEIVPYNSIPYQHSLQLRNHILRKPLGLSLFDEDLEVEKNQQHFVAIEDEAVVGCVVLIPFYEGKTGKLRQMATLEQIRGKGYGKILVKQLEQHARRMGMNKIILNARHHAVDFYAKLGYKVSSEVFKEVGIDHYTMIKSI